MSHVFLQTRHNPQRPDWLAGLRGLEIRNPGTSPVFEILLGLAKLAAETVRV